MTPAPGMQVTPSVRLVAPFRAGGMAAVWVAEHLTLHTRVVVKFISAELAGNEEALARFSREASAAAAVKSPHVVQVFDHGVIDLGGGPTPFIVMELLEGEDLRTRLERGPLTLPEVDAVVSQACKALGQAHRAGVVHRDIKPDNMFLCSGEDGEVFLKLLDFGIAKVEDPTGMGATRTGSVMGTPYYMSPEQVMGLKNVDFRTDLWSLGVVAFEALVGRKAFMGETLGALAVAITHAPMPVPSRFNASFPPALDDWFAKACARTATDRFGSAKEMASAFRAAWGQTPSASSSAVGMPRLSSTTPLLGVRAPDAPPAPMLTTTTSPMLAHADTVAPPMSSSTPIALGVLAVALLLLLLGGGVFFYAKKHAAVAPPDPTTAAASAIPTAPASATASPLLPLEVAPSSPPDPVVKPTHAGPPLGAHVETKHDAGAVKPTANATAAKPDCNPPYYYDSAGDRVFKKECVQ